MGTWAVARLLQVKALEICVVASRVGQYGGGGWGAATGKGVGLLGRGGSIARQGWSVADSESLETAPCVTVALPEPGLALMVDCQRENCSRES